jgi:superfamily II DNA or RNA helicase
MEDNYSSIGDPGFSDSIIQKREFNPPTRSKIIRYLEPHQELVRNYISRYTPYENVLLYHALGQGKTCSAISIAEGFNELIGNERKIIVLVKNKNIQKNFLNELLSECTGTEYIGMMDSLGLPNLQPTKELTKKINGMYSFITYGTFVNRVLGIKEYKKDDLGMSTSEEIGRRNVSDPITNFSNCVIIVDEAHNVTNNEIYTALSTVLKNSFNTRLVLLTATPVYDNCREIFELVNLLNKDTNLPIRNDLIREDFLMRGNSSYINDTIFKGGIIYPTQKGLDAIERSLFGRVSFVPQNKESFPRRRDIGSDLIPGRKGTIKVVYCQMSKWQYIGYAQALLNDSDSSLYKNASDAATIVYVRDGSKAPPLPTQFMDGSKAPPLPTQFMDGSNYLVGKEGFLTVFEQRGKTWLPKVGMEDFLKGENLKKVSIKLSKLLEYIQLSNGPIFIYSNYVNYGGTALVSLLLRSNGYTQVGLNSNLDANKGKNFVMYEDSLDAEVRDSLRKLFNSDSNRYGEKIKILIGSPIASEGITLKNIRQVHILEPTWNMSKLEQIIGRSIRNHSHDSLLQEERQVDIFKYVSVYSRTDTENLPPAFFIDRQKYIICEEKDRANKIVERSLKEIAFDCRFAKDQLLNEPPSTAKCDYLESCELKCKIDTDQKVIDFDNTTFDRHLSFFAKDDINYLLAQLPKLFKKQILWHFDDIKESVEQKINNKFDEQVIRYTLDQIVTSRTKIVDLFGRTGTIAKDNTGNWFIFNKDNIDNGSSFSNTFDFTGASKTPLTFSEWVSLSSDKQIQPKLKKKAKKKEIIELPEEDLKFNEQILESSIVYGTFYSRFGEKDDNFRIIDKRKLTQEELTDKRKQLTGMSCDSYGKKELIELAEYLNPKDNSKFKDKKELCNYIYEYLKLSNKILR